MHTAQGRISTTNEMEYGKISKTHFVVRTQSDFVVSECAFGVAGRLTGRQTGSQSVTSYSSQQRQRKLVLCSQFAFKMLFISSRLVFRVDFSFYIFDSIEPISRCITTQIQMKLLWFCRFLFPTICPVSSVTTTTMRAGSCIIRYNNTFNYNFTRLCLNVSPVKILGNRTANTECWWRGEREKNGICRRGRVAAHETCENMVKSNRWNGRTNEHKKKF